jgi:hypothetical protein
MTLPAGATVYNKRSLPDQPEEMKDFLGRELNVIDRAIKSAKLTPVRSIARDFTLTLDDDALFVDATAGAVTITLPDVRRASARRFYVKKTDGSANAVTVGSSALIDGAATFPLTVQYQSVTVLSDGATWWVL